MQQAAGCGEKSRSLELAPGCASNYFCETSDKQFTSSKPIPLAGEIMSEDKRVLGTISVSCAGFALQDRLGLFR